jgi:dTDP-N-acetylfucosamine:lipid II N-acetylfucosaminyltransferase
VAGVRGGVRPRMNIIHLSNDEKFMPLVQSLFEEAFPQQNRYLIAKLRRGDTPYMAPARQVSHHGSRYFRSRRMARELAAADCLVVHLMSSRFAPALRHVRADCLVVWLAGGGDYMQLIEPRLGSLLLPRTAELVRGLDGTPQRGGSRAWGARLRDWVRPARGQAAAPEPPAVVAVAPRIDVFSANPADAVMLREALPSLRAALHTIPSFTVEDTFAAGAPPMAGPDVLLGNSATPTNNHLEALDVLRGRLPPGGRAVAPLSYGKAHRAYAAAVVEAGRAVLGERFDALTGWLPIDAYNLRVARCGFVFMNHLRQQAVGNISAALYRGATVYMRRANPLFGFFCGLGVTLQAIEGLEDDAAAPLRALTADERHRNRQAIEARYSRAQVLAKVRALEGFRR